MTKKIPILFFFLIAVSFSLLSTIVQSNDNYCRQQNNQQECVKTEEDDYYCTKNEHTCSKAHKNYPKKIKPFQSEKIKITLPLIKINAIEKINELFKKKAIRQEIKYHFETARIKVEKLEQYLNFIIKQFEIENDPQAIASLKKLLFVESSRTARFVIKNEKETGEYSWNLVYLKDVDDSTKQFMIFSNKINIKFDQLTSWFGLIKDFDLSEICSEDNIKMFFSYKLAEHVKNHDEDIDIQFLNQPQISSF